ncbi:hypothetical protein [Dictyobacter aurantiacus]|uniref:DNA topoisomerase I catalytic core eukaryotic-type domain-containing protein n=1 Tax=Dictyobacter aurantiacus TaxID=1936993 RepID=A0A401ZGZ0_9CHLR|nr:hypothetical protein [Dictyobacter aurantiacus]GCE06063.1 hypothetical protein KDAU_33920 [Dictyobacter aurantiacus]
MRAKDFRTWIGSVIAAQTLLEMGICETEKQGKKNVITAIEKAAEQLGNTPAICRKSYVYPRIIDAYMGGSLCKAIKEHKRATSDEEL